MLKLKLQNFGHFMQNVDSLEKILMLGGIGGRMETQLEVKGKNDKELDELEL